MNNKEKRHHPYRYLSRRIFTRYIMSLLLVCLTLFGGFFLAWFMCTRYVWQENDQLYRLLKGLESMSPLFIAVVFSVSFLILTWRAVRKPFTYFSELLEAAKGLSHPTAEPIELPEELLEVQNELNLARERALRSISVAKEAEQRKNDLVVYLAHDLKTPLASVIGYLNLLRDERELSAELEEKYLSISLEKAERLEELINEFFEIARFNLSNIPLQYGTISLNRLLEQLVFEFKPMLQEKGLDCSIRMEEEIKLSCDADKMQRVFDNLLRNAVFYSFENTTVHIVARRENDRVRIQFINHGQTIPEEKLNRIFEQFYRLDASRGTNRGGAGLGLAIAKEIIELHKGSITAESEKEQIRFEVSLPDRME